MELKKKIVAALAAIMVLTSMPSATFAETQPEEPLVIPNFMGSAILDNDACKEYQSFAGLHLEMTVSSTIDPEKTFTVPLQYDEELHGYYAEEYLGQAYVPEMIDDILNNQKETLKELGLDEESLKDENVDDIEEELSDLLDQMINLDELTEKLLNGIFEGYTVTLTGLGEDSHFKAKLFDGSVQTAADQIAAFDLMLVIFGPEEGFKEGEAPQTIKALLDYIAKTSSEGQYESYVDVLTESGIFGDGELEALLAILDEADAYLEAARNGTFPNQLSVTMTLLCDCPSIIGYGVYHQYLVEKDGKLIEIDFIDECELLGEDVFWLEGEEGQSVFAKDFLRETYQGEYADYKGKKFRFTGSYDSNVYWDFEDENLDALRLDSFVLNKENAYDGFVLLYVLEETPETDGTDNDETIPVKVVADDEVEKAPATGDQSKVVLYVVIFAAAACAVIVLLIWKRKQKDK